MASVFCTQCGQQNPEDSKFCARCGAPLTVPATAGTPAVEQTSTISMTGIDTSDDHAEEMPEVGVDALPPGTALLVVKRGPNAGSRFLLDKDTTTAGRHPESDIFLDDVTVSRRHAEFHREDGGFTVSDVGSLNGTYLNRERIETAPLSGGDEVQIGKFRLVFFASDAEATQ
jgi:pSer/pThr/pTyr-binding forkhead associated (FHA) protein